MNSNDKALAVIYVSLFSMISIFVIAMTVVEVAQVVCGCK